MTRLTEPMTEPLPTGRRRKPNMTEDGRFACAFGEYWLGPHPLCQAEVARVCGCEIADVPLPDYSRFDVPPELLQGSLFATEGPA